MNIADLPLSALRAELAGTGLTLRTGSFRTRIASPLASVARGLAALYSAFPVEPEAPFADFHVAVRPATWLRRWYRPLVLFFFDGRSVFKPLPRGQAFPMLEWGLNWCVTTQINHFVLFHAAVVARDDRALILPGAPGSGKSTLCAALVCRGWRLLSDELALLDPADGTLHGLARPISLKNASLDAIRAFDPTAELSEPCHDTLKGTVAHLRPPDASVTAMDRPAQPAHIVFPRYTAGGPTDLAALSPESGFRELVGNAFNYTTLGASAFNAAVDLVSQSTCHGFTYSDLGSAVDRLEELAVAAPLAAR